MNPPALVWLRGQFERIPTSRRRPRFRARRCCACLRRCHLPWPAKEWSAVIGVDPNVCGTQRGQGHRCPAPPSGLRHREDALSPPEGAQACQWSVSEGSMTKRVDPACSSVHLDVYAGPNSTDQGRPLAARAADGDAAMWMRHASWMLPHRDSGLGAPLLRPPCSCITPCPSARRGLTATGPRLLIGDSGRASKDCRCFLPIPLRSAMHAMASMRPVGASSRLACSWAIRGRLDQPPDEEDGPSTHLRHAGGSARQRRPTV